MAADRGWPRRYVPEKSEETGMLPARRVAKEGHRKGAHVNLQRRETTEGPGAAAEDEMAGAPPVAGRATAVRRLPGEPLFIPREDGPAWAWLACASL